MLKSLAELTALLEAEPGRHSFGCMGGPMNPATPEELREFTLSETEAWRKVAKAANIRIE